MARNDNKNTTARDTGADTATIEVSVVEGIDRIVREDWNALLAENDGPFVDWDWLFAMENSKSAVRASGWGPCHLTIHRGKSLIAACPLYLKGHSMGEFISAQGGADAAEPSAIRYYPKLLAGVPFTPHSGRRFLTAPGVARRALVAALGRALTQLCADNKLSSAHVNFCLADEAAALRELGFLERLGYQYHWRNTGFAAFEDYLGALKIKHRYALCDHRCVL